MGMFVVTPASSFHHHHHHHHHDPVISADVASASTALGVGVGVIPLLTATPCLGPSNISLDDPDSTGNLLSSRSRGGIGSGGGAGGGGIQLWQHHQQASQLTTHHYLKKPAILDQSVIPGNIQLPGGGVGGTGGGGGIITAASAAASGTTTCQDCGNQAKKDCTYRRCRTCCKSRGFDCSTHVKSTWVPAARRRERQLIATAGTGAAAGSSTSTSGAKKPRLLASQTNTTNSHTSTSNTTPPRSFDTAGSSRQDPSFKESLPGQVRAPAVFKCVRVTAVEDGDDEYAYQAVVKIGGHVFKGFLYDQGIEGREGFPNISDLHLGSGGAGDRNVASSSSPMIDPTDVYAASGAGWLGGPTYGNPMN